MKSLLNLPESEKLRRLNQSKCDKQKYKDNLYKKRNTPIFDAVYRNDENEINELLSEGWDINHSGEYGRTPLSFAITYSNSKMVDFLISKGAKIDYRAIIAALIKTNPSLKRVESFIALCDLSVKQLCTIIEEAKKKNLSITLPKNKMEQLLEYEDKNKKQYSDNIKTIQEQRKRENIPPKTPGYKEAIDNLDFTLLETLKTEMINTEKIEYHSVLWYATKKAEESPIILLRRA